jgi:hypothetical protein
MKKLTLSLMAAVITTAALAGPQVDVIKITGNEAQAELARLQTQLKTTPTDFEANKSAGIVLHQISRSAPDRTKVELSEKYLKQASQANPKDQETAAWLGSITTMKAMFETDPGKQTFFVKLGARAMDTAVATAPDNLVVRLIRANNSIELPAFLKRSRFAVEDYQHYLALCEKQACPAAEVTTTKANLKLAQKLTAESM